MTKQRSHKITVTFSKVESVTISVPDRVVKNRKLLLDMAKAKLLEKQSVINEKKWKVNYIELTDNRTGNRYLINSPIPKNTDDILGYVKNQDLINLQEHEND